LIVDGFKRLEWLREMRGENASCIPFPAETDIEGLWLWRITGKAFGPLLNVAEKAQLVARLLDFLSSEEERRNLLAHMDVPFRPEILTRWRRLGESSTGLLRAAALGEIGERAALELASWPNETDARDGILGLLGQLRCSASIQMEIIERLSEIAVIRDETRLAVLQDRKIDTVLTHQSWNHREKTQALRDLLARLRFPRLHAREDAFQKHLAELSLPKAIRISPPPSFEGDVFRLQIDFSSAEELSSHIEAAGAIVEDPRLERLMNPTRSGKG
jgi:ParB family transcriptional regulator, chromosome partitioning protein